MVYLKSVLAGIGGAILAVILFVAVIVAINVLGLTPGMIGISFVIPVVLASAGFMLAFYLSFRKSV